ncbi:protein kinase family protein, partial [archaeon]
PEDLADLIPAPYGHLEHGLASPVINPVRLMMLSQERYLLFEQLKMAIADTSSDKTKTAWFFETTEQGSFVCYKHSRFLLGAGSEAKVYLGGFLEGLHGSDERDVIRQHFSLYARPVAIKQFHTKDSQLESSTVRVLPRGVDGILTYLANFEAHDDLYTVQELGLVSLSDRIISEATFEERLTMIRGACLAIRELHRRSGGAIVHRDIRMGNFMLTDNGRIKTCDFGISRVLPDAKKTVLAFGNALSPLTCQPYEVQVAMTQLINQREQAAKTQSFSNMGFLSEDQDYLPVSTSADIFMLGLVLYKLATKVDALSHSDILQKKIADFTLVTKLFSGGHLLAHLLSCMLSHEANKRPSIDQVLEHPFFRSWQENETVVQTLYRELHDSEGHGQGVRYTESFRILESVLQPFEQHVSWPTCLQSLPPHVRSQMNGNQTVPVVLLPDGLGSKPHPLPNIHQAVCWLRYFYAHFRDPKALSWIWMDLRSGVREKESLGEFIHAHPAVSWILPKLWETKVHFLQQIQVERDTWEKDWEAMQRKNEEMHNRFRTHERKVKALI